MHLQAIMRHVEKSKTGVEVSEEMWAIGRAKIFIKWVLPSLYSSDITQTLPLLSMFSLCSSVKNFNRSLALRGVLQLIELSYVFRAGLGAT